MYLSDVPLTLVHLNSCPYTPILLRVAAHLGIELQLKSVSIAELANFPGSIYQESPILVDGTLVVEDWRAIVRHLDRMHGRGELTNGSPAVQCTAFNECERIEREILLPATRHEQPVLPSTLRTLVRMISGRPSNPELASTLNDAATSLRSLARLEAEGGLPLLFYLGTIDRLSAYPDFRLK